MSPAQSEPKVGRPKSEHPKSDFASFRLEPGSEVVELLDELTEKHTVPGKKSPRADIMRQALLEGLRRIKGRTP